MGNRKQQREPKFKSEKVNPKKRGMWICERTNQSWVELFRPKHKWGASHRPLNAPDDTIWVEDMRDY